MDWGMRILVVLLLVANAFGAEDITREVLQRFKEGKKEEALAVATTAIEKEPKNAKLFFTRGRVYSAMNQNEKALLDYDRAVKLDTNSPAFYQERGSAHFKLGHIKESITDFDQFLRMVPYQEAHHWQRGIAYYYAGDYEHGRKQFESHQTVNPYDVENAVWHFLCVARLQGVEKAKASLIHIERDARVPMKEIFALFAGKGKPEDVLAAATTRDHLFYAHLYLGLYYEAHKNTAKAREHIDKAAGEFSMNHYMGDVARVHAKLLKANDR